MSDSEKICEPKYSLRLYIAGATLRSSRAVRVMREICERHLGAECEFEIIDVYQNPDVARNDQVLAVPTLVRWRPLPVRRLIGDMSDPDRVLRLLDIQVQPQ